MGLFNSLLDIRFNVYVQKESSGLIVEKKNKKIWIYVAFVAGMSLILGGAVYYLLSYSP